MPDVSYKCSHSHKLVVDTNINNIQHDCMNYNKDLNSFKEAEKDILALPLQKRECSLNSLSTNSSERRLIETQSVDFPTSNTFTVSETIVVGGRHLLKMSADIAEIPDALDQSALIKLSIKACCNK